MSNTFNAYINSLNTRCSSEHSPELAMVPGSLICYMSTAIEDFIKEKASAFQSSLGLSFVSEKEPEGKVCYLNNPEVRADFKITFASVDLLDYVYAVLHSPSYKEKYKEFARNDFNWVPSPKDTEAFWRLVELGSELRRIHLLESPKIELPVTRFPVSGNNRIDEIRFEMYDYEKAYPSNEFPDNLGAVFINDVQYFADVPVSAWELHLAEQQPAQKWLNDRKGRKLGDIDVNEYQKIIAAMTETYRISENIKKILMD